MILAIIFLLTDLFICGITYMVYGGKPVYSDGMILGVHIRREVQEEPELVEFLEGYRKQVKRIYAGVTVLGVAICGLCFWYSSIFMIAWCIWFVAYLAGALGFLYLIHRKLYDLKIQNGWGFTEDASTTMRVVDTRTIMKSGRMALPLWYHIIPLAILVIPFVSVDFRDYLGTFSPNSQGWILFITSATVGIVFLWIAWIFKRIPNRVYSENSDLNYRINYIEKRSWSICFLGANICNTIAWLYLVRRITKNRWIYNIDIWIYIGIINLSVIVAIAMLIWIKKQKNILQKEDETPLYMDDDYYWRNGWYANPEDARLFVQDRFNSMNYTTNLGRPAGRYLVGGICAGVLVLLIWMCVIFLRMDFTPIRMVREDEEIRITSGYTNTFFETDDMQSVALLEDGMPKDQYNRTNGSDDGKQLLGKFEGKKLGECRMYVWLEYTPVIQIKTKEYTVFINSKDANETKQWYDELKE